MRQFTKEASLRQDGHSDVAACEIMLGHQVDFRRITQDLGCLQAEHRIDSRPSQIVVSVRIEAGAGVSNGGNGQHTRSITSVRNSWKAGRTLVIVRELWCGLINAVATDAVEMLPVPNSGRDVRAYRRQVPQRGTALSHFRLCCLQAMQALTGAAGSGDLLIGKKLMC